MHLTKDLKTLIVGNEQLEFDIAWSPTTVFTLSTGVATLGIFALTLQFEMSSLETIGVLLAGACGFAVTSQLSGVFRYCLEGFTGDGETLAIAVDYNRQELRFHRGTFFGITKVSTDIRNYEGIFLGRDDLELADGTVTAYMRLRSGPSIKLPVNLTEADLVTLATFIEDPAYFRQTYAATRTARGAASKPMAVLAST